MPDNQDSFANWLHWQLLLCLIVVDLYHLQTSLMMMLALFHHRFAMYLQT